MATAEQRTHAERLSNWAKRLNASNVVTDREDAATMQAGAAALARVAALEAALRGFYDCECHCAVSDGRCVQCVAGAALGVPTDSPGGDR